MEYCRVPDPSDTRVKCMLPTGHEGYRHENGIGQDGKRYTWRGFCMCRDDDGIYREPCPYELGCAESQS